MAWQIKLGGCRAYPGSYGVISGGRRDGRYVVYSHIPTGELPDDLVVSTPITALQFHLTKDHGLERLIGFIAFEGYGVFMVEFHNREFRKIFHYPEHKNVTSISYDDATKVFTLLKGNNMIAEF